MDVLRRQLLLGAGAAALCGLSNGLAAETLETQRPNGALPRYVSCGAHSPGDYMVAGFDEMGVVSFEHRLPERGHGIAFRRSESECLVFARRPGRFVLVLQLETGALLQRIDPAAGRHFYGHGAFSADDALLFATENDYETGRGCIGIYDCRAGYRRLGEVPSGGIGPHDIALMPDDATLVVANGGIRTHPAKGRAKLNLPTMAPSLVYIDAASGRLLEKVELPARLHQLSIRHLDVAGDGQVVFAMQYEGDLADEVPLVGLHRRGAAARLLRGPDDVETRTRRYVGDVAFDASGRYLLASSPRGNLFTAWDAVRGSYLAAETLTDVCGLSAAGGAGQFLVSSGIGALSHFDALQGEILRTKAADAATLWDNHLASPSL
ncbi:MAG TPA: DUF1513 domain-containing protein [Kiloniellaceae bacterium]|nr:DUF1513 domain-containing protein [Kiloniellaceae bacterium]